MDVMSKKKHHWGDGAVDNMVWLRGEVVRYIMIYDVLLVWPGHQGVLILHGYLLNDKYYCLISMLFQPTGLDQSCGYKLGAKMNDQSMYSINFLLLFDIIILAVWLLVQEEKERRVEV